MACATAIPIVASAAVKERHRKEIEDGKRSRLKVQLNTRETGSAVAGASGGDRRISACRIDHNPVCIFDSDTPRAARSSARQDRTIASKTVD